MPLTGIGRPSSKMRIVSYMQPPKIQIPPILMKFFPYVLATK